MPHYTRTRLTNSGHAQPVNQNTGTHVLSCQLQPDSSAERRAFAVLYIYVITESVRGTTDSVRYTPHGIEDILGTESWTVGGGDTVNWERDNSGDPGNMSWAESGRDDTDRETENKFKISPIETDHRNTQLTIRKKMRTTFTGRQIFELEKMFETKKYLNSNERSSLSR